MMKKLLMTVVALLTLGGAMRAQVYFQNTMYPYAQFAYNPAAAGVAMPGLREGANISFLGRLQWVGFDGAPQTSAISAHTPLKEGYGAAGLQVIYDQIGPFANTYAHAAYAYNLNVGKMSLRIGVAGGILQTSLNFGRLDNGAVAPTETDDPTIPGGGLNTVVEAINAGIHLSGPNNKFFVSIAGQNLTDPSIDVITGGVDQNNIQTTVSRTFTAAGGYNFELNDKMSLQPAVMMITDFALAPQINGSLLWSITPLTIGINYRAGWSESVGGMLGVNIGSNTFLGYSYDFPLSDLNNNTDINTHELILSYTFSDLFGGKDLEKDVDPIKRDDVGLGGGL